MKFVLILLVLFILFSIYAASQSKNYEELQNVRQQIVEELPNIPAQSSATTTPDEMSHLGTTTLMTATGTASTTISTQATGTLSSTTTHATSS